jgi:putative transposase
VTDAYRFIASEKANYPISLMSRMLGVSRQAFHAWERRPPSQRALDDASLTERIREIHRAARGVYGARRIHAELRMADGINVSRKRVERLMREAGISGLVPRKRGRTTIRVPGVRVADDLVKRDFRPAAPNVLWVADIAYLRSWEGASFFAFVIDAFSRKVVGWQLASHMRTDLVLDALRMALGQRRPGADFQLVAHTDRGSQYLSADYTQELNDGGVLARSAPSGTPMTTRWPRASSTPSRPS